jgi:hypothetical protein
VRHVAWKPASGIAALADLQMSVNMLEGVAAAQDRGNRIFVLVGPPAGESHPSDK